METLVLLTWLGVALATEIGGGGGSSGSCAFQLDFESAVLTSERRVWHQLACHEPHTLKPRGGRGLADGGQPPCACPFRRHAGNNLGGLGPNVDDPTEIRCAVHT